MAFLTREGAGEYELAEGLSELGLAVTQQLPVKPYLIDVACWPVAFEVWTTTTRPHRTELQCRRMAALVRQGWSVCYLHCRTFDYLPSAPSVLVQYRRLVLTGHAPPYAMVRHLEVVTEGWVGDAGLELGEWPDPSWRSFVDQQHRSQLEFKADRRRQRLREAYWRRKHGTEPPPLRRRRAAADWW